MPVPRSTLLALALTAAAWPVFAAESLTPGQLEAANRVYLGTAECEFNEKVSLAPIDGKPGHFRLAFKKASYTMVPQETTTGAVRLVDDKAGVVWLQIPSKSMLMNARLGQRMIDACQTPEQRNSGVVASTQ
jgi:hypothetical protein